MPRNRLGEKKPYERAPQIPPVTRYVPSKLQQIKKEDVIPATRLHQKRPPSNVENQLDVTI